MKTTRSSDYSTAFPLKTGCVVAACAPRYPPHRVLNSSTTPDKRHTQDLPYTLLDLPRHAAAIAQVEQDSRGSRHDSRILPRSVRMGNKMPSFTHELSARGMGWQVLTRSGQATPLPCSEFLPPAAFA